MNQPTAIPIMNKPANLWDEKPMDFKGPGGGVAPMNFSNNQQTAASGISQLK